jgi:hypothetical protein
LGFHLLAQTPELKSLYIDCFFDRIAGEVMGRGVPSQNFIRLSMPMAKEFEGYARECVVLARHAARVELRDQLIQLLRMESSSEPRSRRNFPHL